MKREVQIDTRTHEDRIVEALKAKPMTFDQLAAHFWGEYCEITKCTRNKIPRLEIEICVSRLQKRGIIGVQSKVFFVRDKSPPAFGTVHYAPHRRARKKD